MRKAMLAANDGLGLRHWPAPDPWRNEVDAALEVIGLIDLKGKIVTADALHCNRRMVETIIHRARAT